MSAGASGVAVTVNVATPPIVTGEPAEMVITGRADGSASVISPLPVLDPVAPPDSPVAVRTGGGGVPVETDGMLTVTVSSAVSESASAVSSNVATVADPAALPVNVTVVLCVPDTNTPWGVPSRDSVKSVPGVPPENARGISSASPATSARPRVRTISAVSAASPSVAVASGTLRVTVVGSSSVTSTSAEDAVPTA